MTKEAPVHKPMGEMCDSCDKRFNDCSDLPFHIMPKIDEYKGGAIIVVRCTDYFKDQHMGEVI